MLEYTGERVIPKLMKSTNPLLLEHTARYYFSTPYVKGRVLDVACGSGYGTHMVAKTCKDQIDSIKGIDWDQQSIDYAVHNYYHPRSRFEQRDALAPGLPDQLGTFDTILSFETIEHVADDQLFMRHIWEMLRPGGILVLSTPFGKGRGKPCGSPFHIHQLTPTEFTDLFTAYTGVEVFNQRGVTIEPPRAGVYYPLGVAVCKK